MHTITTLLEMKIQICLKKYFLVDDIVEEICKPDKYFLIGEKGSGKNSIFGVYVEI